MLAYFVTKQYFLRYLYGRNLARMHAEVWFTLVYNIRNSDHDYDQYRFILSKTNGNACVYVQLSFVELIQEA